MRTILALKSSEGGIKECRVLGDAVVADAQGKVQERVQEVVSDECRVSLSESHPSAVAVSEQNSPSTYKEEEIAGERLLQAGEVLTTYMGTLTVQKSLNVIFRREGFSTVATVPALGADLVASGANSDLATEALFFLIMRTYTRLMLRDSTEDQKHPIFEYFSEWRRTSAQMGE